MSAITSTRLLGSVSHDRLHLIDPAVGEIAIDAARGDVGGDAAQILDQRKPQHDRNRPQLAELERRDRLIRGDEAGEAFRVHAAVAVRDRLERDVVDPWQPRRRAAREARQLAAVTLGQMPLRGADLLFDQVEIVEQPFARRRDAPIRPHRRGQQIAGVAQHHLVRGEPGKELVRPAAMRQLVRGCQRPPVLLHLLGAEELGAQRRQIVLRQRRAVTAHEVAERLSDDRVVVCLQRSLPCLRVSHDGRARCATEFPQVLDGRCLPRW